MSEDEADEFALFETLARHVVNTPKPDAESASSGAAGEAADDDTKREDDDE